MALQRTKVKEGFEGPSSEINWEALFALAEKSQIIKVDPIPSSNSDSNPEFVVSASELLLKAQADIPHLWGKFIPSEGLVALAGTSDVGKSAFLRQLAIAVVLKEKEFLGAPLTVQHGKAIFVSTEDGQVATSRNLSKQVPKNVDAKKLDDLHFIFETENLLSRLDSLLALKARDLIVIDAFSDVFDGKINEVSSVRNFLNQYNELANKHHCTIIFLHHIGKRTEALEPNKNNLIGSQGFEGKMRLVMELRQNQKTGHRELYFLKGNYLDAETKKKILQLSFNADLQFTYQQSKVKNAATTGKAGLKKEEVIKRIKELQETGSGFNEAYRQVVKEIGPMPRGMGRTTLSKEVNKTD